MAGLAHAGEALLLLCLLSFGLLTYPLSLALAVCVRLYLALDDAAYWIAEWITRPFTHRTPFAVGFLTAYAAEIAIIWGAVGVWRAWHMSTRLLALADLAWRATYG